MALILVAGVALGIMVAQARYQTLAACTELENRLDEAARPPASMTPVSDESARNKVSALAAELNVVLEQVSTSLEPLTKENADTVSVIAAEAVAIAAKLGNHEISGSILTVEVSGTASRFWSKRRCQMKRRLLVK